MRLLVDCIPYDGGKSGISVYVRNVVAQLAAQGHALTLLTEPGDAGCFPGRSCVEAPGWTRRPVLSMLWHLFVLPFRLRRMGDFDGFVITAANRRACAFYPLPTTATVHDLAQAHVPGKYSRARMFYLRHVLPFFVRRAPFPVAVSRATAADMTARWGIAADRISVLYNGLEPLPDRPQSSCAGGWCAANGLEPGRYLLYVSRIEHPGKNHVNLLRAFALLDRPDLTLVCAGSDWKAADRVHAFAAGLPCAGRIRFTGFLPQEHLREAYEGAAAYVFPSRFEGFGLSLIEAMACGVPCACSDNGALGEIGAGVAETFDPESPEAMAAALRRLLDEGPEARAARIARGRVHAASFSWADHARALAALLAPSPTVRILGIPVGRGTPEEACAAMEAAIASRQPFFPAFVNAHCLNVACRDAAYAALLRSADAVWADGVGVAWAARHAGAPVRGNVNGTDLLPMLFARGRALRVFLLGGAPGVAEAAARTVTARWPNVTVCGTAHGFFPESEEPELLARVRASGAELLLAGLGVPRQELWLRAHQVALGAPVLLGVGALLDFLSGRVPRAPRLLRALRLEWTFRLALEPRRMFTRYILGNPLFILRVLFRKEAP